MCSKSESENYSLANPGEVSSVAENGPKILVDAKIISATLHYSVVMTKDGNIRVKDSYCDSKEVRETYFQRPLYIFHDAHSPIARSSISIVPSFAATFISSSCSFVRSYRLVYQLNLLTDLITVSATF